MEIDLQIWEMAKIFGKWNILNIRCVARLKYHEKALYYVGNDLMNLTNGLNMFGRIYVSKSRLKYVGNDVDLWEIAKICWEMA